MSINRPDALNAVNEELHHAFASIWQVLEADDDVRAVVTTGVGKAFSAGGDMVMFGRLIDDPVARQHSRSPRRERFSWRSSTSQAAGVGGQRARGRAWAAPSHCCAIFLVMGESSYLADPHVPVGLVAGDGGAAMLPLLIGMMKAKEYVLLGDKITADIAKKLNLVTKVAIDDKVLDEAVALGERLAALPPQAVRDTKKAMNMHLSRAALGVLEYALAAEYTSFTDNGIQGACAAFRARSKK